MPKSHPHYPPEYRREVPPNASLDYFGTGWECDEGVPLGHCLAVSTSRGFGERVSLRR
jgi:hypothetical protein